MNVPRRDGSGASALPPKFRPSDIPVPFAHQTANLHHSRCTCSSPAASGQAAPAKLRHLPAQPTHIHSAQCGTTASRQRTRQAGRHTAQRLQSTRHDATRSTSLSCFFLLLWTNFTGIARTAWLQFYLMQSRSGKGAHTFVYAPSSNFIASSFFLLFAFCTPHTTVRPKKAALRTQTGTKASPTLAFPPQSRYFPAHLLGKRRSYTSFCTMKRQNPAFSFQTAPAENTVQTAARGGIRSQSPCPDQLPPIRPAVPRHALHHIQPPFSEQKGIALQLTIG